MRILLSMILLTVMIASSVFVASSEARTKEKNVVYLPNGTKKIPNLYYAQTSDIFQTLDLYLPARAEKPYPVIVWIHGGNWMSGDKGTGCIPARDMSDEFAVASVNYRLSIEAPFPAQIHDLKAAIRFLRANAKRFGIDPNRIGVWGSSAGGHLAALLGTTGDVKELEGNVGIRQGSSRVQAVCDWCGPTNFVSAQTQAGPHIKLAYKGPASPVYNLMGMRMDAQSLAAASPVTYISREDPPFLIMHGAKDDAVPLAQSVELDEALKKENIPSKLIVLKNKGHYFDGAKMSQTVRQFFRDNLK
ncbi:MAG TPA: alpha/beta hydrolase [Candidatus Obscuribacterales bacterium]